VLHNFNEERDIEILGLIVSCYAYGQVNIINSFITKFLERINYKVYEFTSNFSKLKDKKHLKGLNYRFNKDIDFVYLIANICGALKKHGSLNDLFLRGYAKSHENILPAAVSFASELSRGHSGTLYYRYLIPNPLSGSACKRLMLYFRWMVRKDDIDLGVWKGIDRAKLIIPVDTHIYRVAQKLKLVERKSCDMKFAVELTEKLKQFDPKDPVKYDFALCHVGIDKKDIGDFSL
jgi:uncharacterized protein (TIGR02757 family)